ncbi:hypothetical protein HBH51_258620 [Parastagonospora nodorum]|nr:hypothetical protein HBH51_258620 [Parastagonospora nodorum]
MERYSGSYVLCSRCVLLIYPPPLDITVLSTHLKSASSFSSCYAVPLVARQCRRRRNAAQQIRRVQRPS